MKKILLITLTFIQLLAFAQSINLTGNLGSINTCNTDFYDSGGSGSSYQNNENYSVTFYPSGSGNIQMIFTIFSTEMFYDSLFIYDGPIVNPQTLIGGYSGQLNPFTVTSTNPNGCLTLTWKTDQSVTYPGWEASLICVALPIVLNAQVNGTPCNTANGSIDLTTTGGVAPYTYLWSTGATTEDISGLIPGIYIVNVSDSTGYSLSDTFYINANNLVITPTITSTACDSTGGAIDLGISGGTAPYLIMWNNNQIGNPLNNLSPGGYSATVYDANGCFAYWSDIVKPEDSCTLTISGYIYNDINGNCVQDAGENPITSSFVNITPGGGTFTDANGYYEFQVSPGTYDVEYFANPFTSTSACSAGFIQTLALPNYGMNAFNTNFPLQYQTVQDLSISLYENAYIPGANHTSYILYQNNSSMSMTPTITWQHDPLITPTTYSVAPTTYDPVTHTAVWNLPSMLSLTSSSITINSLTDSTAQLGAVTTSNAQITPLIGDIDITDNQDSTSEIVVASFDPNQKRAYPLGEGAYHFISPSTNLLHYTIDFQNTGSYPAGYVVIRDTIDPSLNAFSIQPTVSSHPYTLDLENDNILVFRFNNINLPDATTNEPASHGFVTYTIQTQTALPLGTSIHNSASIYFDFNTPITTNTTLHTIYLAPTSNIPLAPVACEGTNITVTATNGVAPYTFSWSNGTIDNNNMTGSFTTPLSTLGNNTVTVTDMYGTISNTAAIEIEPTPTDASFTFNIIDDTLFLTPNTIIPATYTWDFGNGQTSTLVNPYLIITTSEYNVTLTITNSCTSIQQTQTLMTTSITNTPQGNIQLFPNPMTDQAVLTVNFPNHKPYSVQLTDITGKALRKWENVSDEKLIIQKETLPSGTYFIEVKGENTFIQKLLIK